MQLSRSAYVWAARVRTIALLLLGVLASKPALGEMVQIDGPSDLEAGRQRDSATLSPVLRPLFSSGLQRYMIDLFAYDPVEIAKCWQGPTLILQGDADFQVKPQDADFLAKAMPQATRMDLRGATHMLKSDVAGSPTYTNSALPLHPDLVPSVVQYLKRVAGP